MIPLLDYFNGNHIVSESGGNRIRKISLQTNIISTLAGSDKFDHIDGQDVAAYFHAYLETGDNHHWGWLGKKL